MLPHPPASSTRPTTSSTAPTKPTQTSRATAIGQPGLEPCTPALPKSQNILHRLERRGRVEASDSNPNLGSRSTPAPRNSQRLWSPDRVDWGQINREAASAANLQQKIVDQIKEEEQLVPVEPHLQQQKKVQLQIQFPEHKIVDRSKQRQQPAPVQSKQSQPAWELASSGSGNRLPRKAKTSSHYTPQSTPTDTQQPEVLPQPAQGGRPSSQAARPGQAGAESSQHDPSEQQQLKGRATGWLRAALRGRSKK